MKYDIYLIDKMLREKFSLREISKYYKVNHRSLISWLNNKSIYLPFLEIESLSPVKNFKNRYKWSCTY